MHIGHRPRPGHNQLHLAHAEPAAPGGTQLYAGPTGDSLASLWAALCESRGSLTHTDYGERYLCPTWPVTHLGLLTWAGCGPCSLRHCRLPLSSLYRDVPKAWVSKGDKIQDALEAPGTPVMTS